METNSGSGSQLAARLVNYRWWLLGLALVLGVAGFALSRQLDFDRSIESMFSPRDPVLQPYRELKRLFGGNEIVLAVYDEPNLLDPSGAAIRRLTKVSSQLTHVRGVQDILSLAEVNQALVSIYSLASLLGRSHSEYPIVDPDSELAREFLDIFEGYTHSADGRTVSMVCMLEAGVDSLQRRETIEQLRRIIAEQPSGKVTGEPVLISDGFEFVERDGRRLGQVSILLLALVIVLCFRSLRWVLIPIAVVYWSLWVSQAIIVLLGLELSMVSSMLTAIVTVIGVATVIHLIVRFREARKNDLSRLASVRSALDQLIAPICWACITDAAGFAALLVADTGPVRDFGLMMSVASLCVLLAILLLVPGLSLLGPSVLEPRQVWGERNLKSALQASTGVMRRHSRILAACILVAFAVVSLGIFRLQVETDFTKNFKAGTEIAEAYRFVEERLGGAGVLDVVVPAPKFLSSRYLEKVTALEDELREIRRPDHQPALSKVVSLADLDRASRQLPGLSLVTTPEVRFQGMAQVMPTFANAMRRTTKDMSEPDFLRIMLRTSHTGTAESQQKLIAEVDRIARRHFPANEAQRSAFTSGIYVLLSHLVSSLLQDQLLTFAMASFLIFGVMCLALRSVPLATIAMLPNVIPIAMLMGTLGWLGVKLNMGAVMIAAVSIGLSIDSSIHYLYAYRRWMNRGSSVFEAVQQVQHRVGRAAMFSTLALVAGFATLCVSQFVPTIYFGALVSLSMLGGLFGNLVVLPTMLFLFSRD